MFPQQCFLACPGLNYSLYTVPKLKRSYNEKMSKTQINIEAGIFLPNRKNIRGT